MLATQQDSLAQIRHALAPYQWTLTSLRVGVVTLLCWQWQGIAHRLYPKTIEHAEHKRAAFLAWRGRFLVGFLFIEVFIANAGFRYLISRFL